MGGENEGRGDVVGGVLTGKAVFGTLADDTFMVNSFVSRATIDGLRSTAVTLKNIEKIITNDNIDLDIEMAGQLRGVQ